MSSNRILCMLLVFVLSGVVVAQDDPVLMVVNGKKVLRSEFEYFYNKNTGFEKNKQIPLKEYVELFVNFKLKVAAAEQAGMDTTSVFREELAECRRQLTHSYLIEQTAAEKKAREEYDRMAAAAFPGELLLKRLFFRLPQQTSSAVVRQAEQRMDSLYNQLLRDGSKFDEYILLFSDTKEPLRLKGWELPEELEAKITDLPIGSFTRPFFTSEGLNIVKIIERKPLPLFEEIRGDLMRKTPHADGTDEGTIQLVEALKREYGYMVDEQAVNELMVKGSTDKVLFQFAGVSYTGDAFARFSRTRTEGLQQQFQLFVTKSLLDYENSRLEQKYPNFRLLMNEYKEGILLYEISNQEVWTKVDMDGSGEALAEYFKKNRSRYRWETPRYRGAVLQCNDKNIGKQVRKLLKKLPETEWTDAVRLTANSDAEQVKIVQGTFALGDNPFVDQYVFHKGKAEVDFHYPVVLLLGKKQKAPESHEEVKTVLLEDYQQDLEMRWLARLRTAFKVEIDQEVLKTVNNR